MIQYNCQSDISRRLIDGSVQLLQK